MLLYCGGTYSRFRVKGSVIVLMEDKLIASTQGNVVRTLSVSEDCILDFTDRKIVDWYIQKIVQFFHGYSVYLSDYPAVLEDWSIRVQKGGFLTLDESIMAFLISNRLGVGLTFDETFQFHYIVREGLHSIKNEILSVYVSKHRKDFRYIYYTTNKSLLRVTEASALVEFTPADKYFNIIQKYNFMR